MLQQLKPPRSDSRFRRLFRLVATLRSGVFLIAIAAGAQVIYQTLEPTSVPTIEEQLKKYGIGIARNELIAALGNPQAVVRELACWQLASEKDKDAIPFIKTAASIELNDTARINMYASLAALGDQASINLLENTCVDAKTAPGLRVHAAEDLLNVSKNRKCLPAVLSMAQSATEDTARAEALTLLPNYFLKGGEAPTDEVLTAICGGLTDGSLFVRMQSTASLERIGTSRQATCLETALSQEQDETSRNAMKRVLKSLRSRAAL